MQNAGPPRWLTISAGISVVLLGLMIAGARGLQLHRHYWNIGGGVLVAFEDSGLSIYTPDEYRPYRGRSLSIGLRRDHDDRVTGFEWPFYYQHVRWSPGHEQWMVTIDLPILLFLASILPLVWCGWQAQSVCRSIGPTRSRFRISIRTVLLLFFAMGALLSLRQYSRAQGQAAEFLEARGARFDWDCTDSPQSRVIWLLFGDNEYDDLLGVRLAGDSISSADISLLQRFPNLMRLTFTDCEISDEAVQRLADLPRLRKLALDRCIASAQAIEACARSKEFDEFTVTHPRVRESSK